MQLSNMAQRKRAGLITRRTLDRNQVLLRNDLYFLFLLRRVDVRYVVSPLFHLELGFWDSDFCSL